MLEYDPKNLKASYRLAQALFHLSEGENASQIKAAFKHASTAHNGLKNDEKVKAFYEQVKAKHEEIKAKEEAAKKVKEEEERTKKSKLEDKLN